MYRPNVCVVITNKKRNKVLMFHRIGAEEYGWQFPQGGVDPGETEIDAFYRELKEEIGTDDIEVLGFSKQHLKYKFPKWVLEQFASKDQKQKQFKGQRQRWFLIRLNQGVKSISFAHHPPEFDAFKWVKSKKAVKRIIPFKRKVYKKGMRMLGLLNS